MEKAEKVQKRDLVPGNVVLGSLKFANYLSDFVRFVTIFEPKL
jgi:hypothetical protein